MWVGIAVAGPLDCAHKFKGRDQDRVVVWCGFRIPEHLAVYGVGRARCRRCLRALAEGGQSEDSTEIGRKQVNDKSVPQDQSGPGTLFQEVDCD